MRNGKYGNGNTKFNKLALNKCNFTLWDSYNFNKSGCGATALGLITGQNPHSIKTKNGHFSDRFMVNFLRDRNFSVYEVNKANLSNKKIWSHSLLDNHLILFSILTQKKEATWMVMFNNIIYHNFEQRKANYIDFLNFPMDSLYVLYKKSWAVKNFYK